MIKPKSISGFYDNLPEEQLLEDRYKEILRQTYALSGFTPLGTPVIERLEILTSKGADDNEIYGLHRINGEQGDDSSLGLRFDLTVPFARYVAQNEGVLTFPFKRQHIARVYRGERPQKGRFREFYQADVDIVGNGKLPLFADVEILSTIYNALKKLDFGDFIIHINNKKLLQGFLEEIGIEKIKEIISVIDKKDKLRKDALEKMFQENSCNQEQINKIFHYIDVSEKLGAQELLDSFSEYSNETLQEGLTELQYVYQNLLSLGVPENSMKINPAISRGLNYYTGTVFETFIVGAEKMGSISSGGRYNDLASHFTKNQYPGVGGSICLTRLVSVLRELEKLEYSQKTPTKILVIDMSDRQEIRDYSLGIVRYLRENNIASEIYMDNTVKLQKQFKYADNKNIPYVVVIGEDEYNSQKLPFKTLATGEQIMVSKEELIEYIK